MSGTTPNSAAVKLVERLGRKSEYQDTREVSKRSDDRRVYDASPKVSGRLRSLQERGYARGDSIDAIHTALGTVGIAVCYEIHMPEVSRVLALNGARVIFNPIGTGMWNEEQLATWTAVARTRAYENGAFVVGCSHFNDAIPVAFAYAPGGTELVVTRDTHRLVPVVLDFVRFPHKGHFDERRPELYGRLVKPGEGMSTTD